MSSLANCLTSIARTPGMWLGRFDKSSRSLAHIQSFITGFQWGQASPPDVLQFEHFTHWVAAHYRRAASTQDGFTLIREKVNGDEDLAFDEFFRLLPEFVKDMEQVG